MSFRRRFGPAEKRLNADSATVNKYEPFTGWVTSHGIDAVQCVVKAKGHDGGQLQGAVAIQYADVRGDNPGPWAIFDNTYVTSGSPERNTLSLAIAGNGKAAFRLGIVHKLGSGSTYSESGISLEGAYLSKGEVLTTVTLDIALEIANVWQTYAISDFIPTIHFNKVKWVIVTTSVEGTGVETRGAYRTADTSVQQATAWRVASTDWTPSYASNSGANEFAPAEYALATNATHAFVQFGVAARFTSGTSARVTISVVLMLVVD